MAKDLKKVLKILKKGVDMDEEKVKEIREIIVPVGSVCQAAELADSLSKCLRIMKHGRGAGTDAASIALHFVAEKIENGKTLEQVMEEIEREVLRTLAERHETSKALAVVLKKGEGAVRAMLMRRGISLRDCGRGVTQRGG